MKRIFLHAATAAFASIASLAAIAEGGHRRAPPSSAYVQECAACHAPFPPSMLAAGSWQRIMHGLSRHFGTDAALEPAVRDEIAAWLVSNAGTGRRVDANPPQDRITRSAAFVRKHHEVPTAAWTRPPVGQPSNCAACHPRAEQGDFNEHDARIPR